MWSSVKQAISKGKKETHFRVSDDDLTEEFKNHGDKIDPSLFNLTHLTSLYLGNSSSLIYLPKEIGLLTNLNNMEVCNTYLSYLPDDICKLPKLKYLGVSQNKLQEIPESLNKMPQLQTFIARNNNLEEIISFSECPNLRVLDIRFNRITNIDNVCGKHMAELGDLQASDNSIQDVPDSISNLVNLKVLNLANNEMKQICRNITSCTKLKELNLKGNPLSDRRLVKVINQERTQVRHIFEHIKQHSKNDKTAQAKTDKKNKSRSDEVASLCAHLTVLPADRDFLVNISTGVLRVRGFLVCCILRGIDLSDIKLKKFLSIQTKLHESVCEKRLSATIATHDLTKVKQPLLYTSRPPLEIKVQPLNKSKVVAATSFFNSLKMEAETQRKQMKRNTVSGIHKYVSLLDGLVEWPCLVDADDTTISLPPLTNSHDTRIRNETRDIFVEVTSHLSLQKAKEVMEALVAATLEADELCLERTEKDKASLQVEQVRVLNQEDGTLRVLFPAKADLDWDKPDSRVVVERR